MSSFEDSHWQPGGSIGCAPLGKGADECGGVALLESPPKRVVRTFAYRMAVEAARLARAVDAVVQREARAAGTTKCELLGAQAALEAQQARARREIEARARGPRTPGKLYARSECTGEAEEAVEVVASP
jgi:hypothetical protein